MSNHLRCCARICGTSKKSFPGHGRVSGWVALLAVVLFIRPVEIQATDALEPIGVSMQSRMRGGADVAVGDSALSQVDNPGTLSLAERGKFSLDQASKLCIVDLPWRGPFGNTEHSDTRLIHLHNVGLAMPYNDKLTFGLALHSKSGVGTRFYMRHLLIPFMERRVNSDFKNLDVQLNAAYKITDKLSLGLGIRTEVATARFGTVLGPADVNFGRGYAYGLGFQTGLHYQMREDLAFGLAYRSPSWFGDLDGGNGKASILGIVPVQLGKIGLADFELPQRISGGVAWDVTKKLKLVGEVRWTNYSNSSFHKSTVTTGGIVDLRVPLPLGYQDIWTFIIGSEYKLTDRWTVAAGYHYLTKPLNNHNLLPIADIPTQHHITTGIRYDTGKWWAGGGYVLALSPSMSGASSRIPLGVDYNFSKINQTQHMLSVGFGFRW